MTTFLRIATTHQVRLINLDQVIEAIYEPCTARHLANSGDPPEALLTLRQLDGVVRVRGPEGRAAAGTLGLFPAGDAGREHTSVLTLSGDPDCIPSSGFALIRREPPPVSN